MPGRSSAAEFLRKRLDGLITYAKWILDQHHINGTVGQRLDVSAAEIEGDQLDFARQLPAANGQDRSDGTCLARGEDSAKVRMRGEDIFGGSPRPGWVRHAVLASDDPDTGKFLAYRVRKSALA